MCFSSPKPPDIPEAPLPPPPPEALAERVENPRASGIGEYGRRRRGKSSLIIPRRTSLNTKGFGLGGGLNIPQ